jgi:hypothetical protein
MRSVLYSTAVIQLLRPLLTLKDFPPRVVEAKIWAHAQQGLALLDQHYRKHWNCQYQPVLQMFAVLHLADVIARFFPKCAAYGSKSGPEAIESAIQVLAQSPGLPVAHLLQEMLRKTARDCAIQVPRNVTSIIFLPTRNKQSYHLGDFINACTRPTYLQPVSEIQQRFLPSFSADWAARGRHLGFVETVFSASEFRELSAEENGAQNLIRMRSSHPNQRQQEKMDNRERQYTTQI